MIADIPWPSLQFESEVSGVLILGMAEWPKDESRVAGETLL